VVLLNTLILLFTLSATYNRSLSASIEKPSQEKKFFQKKNTLGTIKNLAIVEPRGFGKSSKMLATVLWSLLTGKKKFVVYVSNSFDKATDLVNPVKHELENNRLLLDVYGSQVSQKWASGEFELANGSKVLARGRGQNIRGLKHLQHRPDLVICDDIEDDEEVESKEQRIDTQDWLDKQVMKGVDNANGNIIFVGTVLHPDSLIANIATKEERCICREMSGDATIKYVGEEIKRTIRSLNPHNHRPYLCILLVMD